MSKLKIVFLGFIFLTSTTACADESNQALSPDNVLYGTDVKAATSFKSIKSNNIQGSYVTEMGGASLSLEITNKDKNFLVKRVFVEPGIPAETKEYIFTNSGEFFNSNGKAKIVVVEDGLLLFELTPGSYGVPTDMWVYYQKK